MRAFDNRILIMYRKSFTFSYDFQLTVFNDNGRAERNFDLLCCSWVKIVSRNYLVYKSREKGEPDEILLKTIDDFLTPGRLIKLQLNPDNFLLSFWTPKQSDDSTTVVYLIALDPLHQKNIQVYEIDLACTEHGKIPTYREIPILPDFDYEFIDHYVSFGYSSALCYFQSRNEDVELGFARARC